MARFTVTTARDVIDADDGLLSLREAIASATADASSDTIVFAGGLDRAALERSIEINAGEVRIDGDTDGEGRADVEIGGRSGSALIAVGEGAGLTLAGVRIAGVRIEPENPPRPPEAAPGADGAAGAAPEHAAVAAILNRGALSLERVDFADIVSRGQSAGAAVPGAMEFGAWTGRWASPAGFKAAEASPAAGAAAAATAARPEAGAGTRPARSSISGG